MKHLFFFSHPATVLRLRVIVGCGIILYAAFTTTKKQVKAERNAESRMNAGEASIKIFVQRKFFCLRSHNAYIRMGVINGNVEIICFLCYFSFCPAQRLFTLWGTLAGGSRPVYCKNSVYFSQDAMHMFRFENT